MKINEDNASYGKKKAFYEKSVKAADKAIMRGDVKAALPHAKEGFELGLELHEKTAAGQYLFCLNELGRFEETLEAAERYWKNAKSDDEPALANTLCAMLASGSIQAERGMTLLKKLKLASISEWRRRFSRFDYNPVQTSLIFNAALIFYNAGREQDALRLLKEVMEHMLFFIDAETDGKPNLSVETAETIYEFLSLIDENPELNSLKNEEVWHELSEITENFLV